MKSRKKRNYLKYKKCGKPHKINKNQNRTGEEKYDKSTIRMPRQYTNRARKPLIFLDFLKLTEKIYYLFTTY